MRQWQVWYIGIIWMLAETSIYGITLFGPILIEAALTGSFKSGKSAAGEVLSCLLSLVQRGKHCTLDVCRRAVA